MLFFLSFYAPQSLPSPSGPPLLSQPVVEATESGKDISSQKLSLFLSLLLFVQPALLTGSRVCETQGGGKQLQTSLHASVHHQRSQGKCIPLWQWQFEGIGPCLVDSR